MFKFIKKLFAKPEKRIELPAQVVQPTFDIPYEKLYEADGRDEGVTLTANEVSELLSYIQHVTWLLNPPKE